MDLNVNSELQAELAEILRETDQAHREALSAATGQDPDWPIWYADYLLQPLTDRLGLDFYRSKLVYCLMDAHFEHQALSPDSPWPEFYAHQILERYAPAEEAESEKFALYHYVGCPFCTITRSAIDRLGIDVELRDIFQDPQHRRDLIAARGRATVPVLRITSPDGEDRWVPESRDIVQYLRSTFA